MAARFLPSVSGKGNDRRAFTQRQTIAPGVEGTADGGRERLQSVKTRKHQFTERVITACQNALSPAITNHLPGVADGVAAGSAGIRDDRDRPAGTDGIENHPRLDLWLIVDRAGGLEAMTARLLHRLAKICLTKRHAARGRAQNQRQIPLGFPAGLLPCLAGGQQQQGSSAIEPGNLSRVEVGRRQGHRQINFRGTLRPLAADIEQRHGTESGASRPKTLRVGFPTESQSRNDSGTGDDHPGRR